MSVSASVTMLYYALLLLLRPALAEDILQAIFFTGKEGNELELREDQTTPETENIKSKEHTICFRYKSVIFTSNLHFTYRIHFSDDVQTRRKLKVADSYAYWLYIMPPDRLPHMVFNENGVLVNMMAMLAQGGTYFIEPEIDKINVDEWHHFCGGSSVPDMRTFFVQNGKTAYNHTQPEAWGSEENIFWSNALKKPFRTYLPGKNETDENLDTWGSTMLSAWSTDFYITDFNVWGRALSRKEMYDFTTCKVINSNQTHTGSFPPPLHYLTIL